MNIVKFGRIGYNTRMTNGKTIDPNAARPASSSASDTEVQTKETKPPVTQTKTQQVQRPVSEVVTQRPSDYDNARQVPHYMERPEGQTANALEIRLPWLSITIQDRRTERAEQRDRSHEHDGRRDHDHDHDHDHRRTEGRGTHARRPGVAEETPEMAAAVKKAHGMMAAADAEAALKMSKFGGKERPLSPFEKTLIARFEEGMKQVKESADGQFHFLKKSAGEWTGFFEKFVSRTMQKVINWEDIQGILFRGLLQEKGASQKGVMISDVMTAMGTDKFARISVALNKAQQLAMATPGAVLTKEALQGAVLGEQLRYLTVTPQQGEEGGVQFGRAASRGMFSSQQLESRVAEHLGLVTDFRGAGIPGVAQNADEKRSAERRRRGGLWSRLFGDDDVEGDGSVFVPWWRWDREERSGFRRWFVVVFGSVIFVALFFLLIVLVRALKP